MSKGVFPLGGMRVLVVEDDEDTREVLGLGLTLYGADVVSVGTAADALATLEEDIPDVILSDIGLPDEDGLALMRRIRQLPPSRGGRVPAVAVTAFTLADDGAEATRAGFQRHFRKPVDTRALFDAIIALAKRGRIERRYWARRSQGSALAAAPPAIERRGECERRTA